MIYSLQKIEQVSKNVKIQKPNIIQNPNIHIFSYKGIEGEEFYLIFPLWVTYFFKQVFEEFFMFEV